MVTLNATTLQKQDTSTQQVAQSFTIPTVHNTNEAAKNTFSRRESATGELNFLRVVKLADLDKKILETAICVYRAAFSTEPYFEYFNHEEALESLQFILDKNGDLFLGIENGETVSLTGGYLKRDGTYFVEELAVKPDKQQRGLGRKTLNELLRNLDTIDHSRKQIRTVSTNFKAINLYQSEGFIPEYGLITAFHMRKSHNIELDERVYLSNPVLTDSERIMNLKHFVVAYPSGNTTAIVFDKLLDVDRKTLNQHIMSTWKDKMSVHPEIEQCCFVTKPQNPKALARVEMFGGEFCGNATRSAVWVITKGQNYKGLIEVSGVPRPLEFSVNEGQVSVEMPLPQLGTICEIVEEGTLVFLDGITHLVIQSHEELTDPRDLFSRLKEQNKYNCTNYPAFGVTFYNPDTQKSKFCVWVKAVDTVFDESACGSGTCSIGIAMANRLGHSVDQIVIQPSNQVIKTTAEFNAYGKFEKSFIIGEVSVLYNGEFKLI